MSRCLFCCEDKTILTDEHIIPAALGGNLKLPKSTCAECQTKCNQSFEQRFLKGSNFVALLRAYLGIRGRRNQPIYGFDSHGDPLTVTVQPGFPAIRVGIAVMAGQPTVVRPMQVILTNPDRFQEALSYHFLPETIERPITQNFFNNAVDTVHQDATHAAFWVDGDILPLNYWRELLEAFVVWSNSHGLTPMTSVIAAGNVGVNLNLDWNTEYNNRGLAKIGFMYAMSQMEEERRCSCALDLTRRYIREGMQYLSDYQPYSPVVQWNGAHPGEAALGETQFHYLLATVNTENGLFSLVQLHNMGLFAVKLATAREGIDCPNTLTTYLLEKNDDNRRYSLTAQSYSSDVVETLVKATAESQQLY